MRTLLLSLVIILVFTGCYNDPDFGEVPRLTDISVYTKSLSSSTDSLVIRVGFEDGDGDLGLRENEEPEFYLLPNPVTGEVPWIYDKNDPEQIDYNCRDFRDIDVDTSDTLDRRDTVRIEYNDAYFNFGITLFRKKDSQYQEVSLVERNLDCGAPLGGRFFPLKDDLDTPSPLKGVLEWGTVGAYSLLYRNDTLRVDVVVRDRAGNVSNTITLEDFTLKDIRRSE